MKTNEVNNENVLGMFLCWIQVSNKLQKSETESEWTLLSWLYENAVHRTVTSDGWRRLCKAIDARVELAHQQMFDDESPLQTEYHAPDELTSGYIRIWRKTEPKACINIPVIDWRGVFTAA